MRSRQRDPMRRRVHCRHPDHLIIPVIAPIALQPDTVRNLPPRWLLTRILKCARLAGCVAVPRAGAGLDDSRDGGPALVGPARQFHALVAAEQFRAGRGAVVGGGEGRRADTQRLYVRLPHFAACRRIEPLHRGAVLHRLPGRRRQLAPALETHALALGRLPGYQMLRGA